MGDTIPLFAHPGPEATFAYRAGQPVPAWQFLADVLAVAALLPPGAPVLNACSDRYRFAVTLGACLLSGTRSLLPPTHSREVIRQLRHSAPEAVCLSDDARCELEMPQIPFPATSAPQSVAWRVPRIPAKQVFADVFTSGSTGVPVAHRKSWGSVVRCVQIEAARLGLYALRPCAILATVPPQHMYGLETSVLVALQGGVALCAERPFYPADIRAALGEIPVARVLVVTPVHLRALLASGVALPQVALVVSATAPLELELARTMEQRCGAPLLEIYGSTETGQIASRRPTQSPEWELFTDIQLSQRDERIWAEGGHIEFPTPLGDQVQIIDERHFLLGDRLQDVVNIAGKRNSIGYLNHQLLEIPGVQDGAFFLPEETGVSHTGVVRLCAVVVAPGLDAATLLRQLRDRIDPVFLPRPLRLVDVLPRNSTGKLPLQLLRSLLERP